MNREEEGVVLLEGEKFGRGFEGCSVGFSLYLSGGVHSYSIKIAASWFVIGVNMLHSPSFFFHFSYILPICKATNSVISLNFTL